MKCMLSLLLYTKTQTPAVKFKGKTNLHFFLSIYDYKENAGREKIPMVNEGTIHCGLIESMVTPKALYM